NGNVTGSSLPPAILWKFYAGPGTVAFGNLTNAATSASFNTIGDYTLMLSADDSVHAVAYDAVVVHVVSPINVSISRTGTQVKIDWNGGTPPYVLEHAILPGAISWFPC